MADRPQDMGQAIAEGIPGVSILMLLKKLGQQIPGLQDKVMEMLGANKPAPPPGPLPRGFVGPDGQPIIVQPGQPVPPEAQPSTPYSPSPINQRPIF